MTMPLGSVEEPDETYVMEQSVPVRVVSTGRGSSCAEFGKWRLFTFAPGGGAQRIANRSLRRKRLIIKVDQSLQLGILTAPATPAFPGASNTNVQNTNPYPVLVTVTGGAVTLVTVNGATVGTGDGTYLVPSGAAIAVTWTVAPTWSWANGNAGSMQASTDGVMVMDRDVANNVTGPNGILPTLGMFQAGGYLQINDNVRWEVQQELWAVPITGLTATVYLSVSDEMYASDPMNSGKG